MPHPLSQSLLDESILIERFALNKSAKWNSQSFEYLERPVIWARLIKDVGAGSRQRAKSVAAAVVPPPNGLEMSNESKNASSNARFYCASLRLTVQAAGEKEGIVMRP
jgi:hypothetical protein